MQRVQRKLANFSSATTTEPVANKVSQLQLNKVNKVEPKSDSHNTSRKLL